MTGPLTPPRPRWHDYVTEGRVFCGPRPGGHHIPSFAEIPEYGFIRCSAWIDVEKRECGRWVFLYVVRGGKVVVAEVDLEEKKAMRKLLTPAAMIEYLRIFER